MEVKSATKKFKEEINVILKDLKDKGILKEEEDFYYLNDYKMTYVRKREKPNIKLISDMEIKHALIISLILGTCLDKDGLIKNAGLLLGYHSVSKVFKTRCIKLISLLENNTMNSSAEGYVLKESAIQEYKK